MYYHNTVIWMHLLLCISRTFKATSGALALSFSHNAHLEMICRNQFFFLCPAHPNVRTAKFTNKYNITVVYNLLFLQQQKISKTF